MITRPTRFLMSCTRFRFTRKQYIHRPQHCRMPRVRTLTGRDPHESEVAQHLLIFVPDHISRIPPLLRLVDFQLPLPTLAIPRGARDHLASGSMRMEKKEIVAQIQTAADFSRIWRHTCSHISPKGPRSALSRLATTTTKGLLANTIRIGTHWPTIKAQWCAGFAQVLALQQRKALIAPMCLSVIWRPFMG